MGRGVEQGTFPSRNEKFTISKLKSSLYHKFEKKLCHLLLTSTSPKTELQYQKNSTSRYLGCLLNIDKKKFVFMTRKSHNHRTATRERDTEQCQPHNRKNTFSKVTISPPLHQHDECKTKNTSTMNVKLKRPNSALDYVAKIVIGY